MSRETKYTAVILKKSPFNEGDEIITFYSQEGGKIRALAKSVKLQKSKLQARLQGLFLVNVILTGAGLPKIISVEVKEVFQGLRENLFAMKIAFFAVELVLKFTPDEQKSEPLFNLLVSFFEFLNTETKELVLNLGLLKFKVEILNALGLGLNMVSGQTASEVFFNASRGGFSLEKSVEALPVSATAYKTFLTVKNTSLQSLNQLSDSFGLEQLQNLLSGFIEYQLERKVKSEKYLKA